MTVDKDKSRTRIVSRSSHFMYHVQTRCHRNIQSIIKQISKSNRNEHISKIRSIYAFHIISLSIIYNIAFQSEDRMYCI